MHLSDCQLHGILPELGESPSWLLPSLHGQKLEQLPVAAEIVIFFKKSLREVLLLCLTLFQWGPARDCPRAADAAVPAHICLAGLLSGGREGLAVLCAATGLVQRARWASEEEWLAFILQHFCLLCYFFFIPYWPFPKSNDFLNFFLNQRLESKTCHPLDINLDTDIHHREKKLFLQIA